MVREIITLNVGQCGVQLGQSVWEQYCAEHEIDASGKKKKAAEDDYFLNFYEETRKGRYVPRNLMVDLEPTAIDNVKNCKYSNLFPSEFLLSGVEDAENNFARGHYTVGAEMMDKVNDGFRRLVDNCEKVQGFILNHSVGGGTGSGLGCLILEMIADGYGRKSKYGFEVYPSPLHSNCVTDVYNSLLSTHWLLDHTDVSVVYDNQKMYEICQKNLKIAKPSHHNMNRLLSKNISGITASLRFEGESNVDLNEFQTDLVPFSRLHFLLTGMGPIISKYDAFDSIYGSIDQSPLIKQLNVPSIVNEEIAQYAGSVVNKSVHEITNDCCDSKNFFVHIDDFDCEEDHYMAMCINYRGDVKAKEANIATQWLKTNKKVVLFYASCPTESIRANFNADQLVLMEDDDICTSERSAVMVQNNTGIGRFFSKRILKKFEGMYAQRAYVHHYLSEGMEEVDFAEAKEDLGYLERDYLDVLGEQATDDDDSDSD